MWRGHLAGIRSIQGKSLLIRSFACALLFTEDTMKTHTMFFRLASVTTALVIASMGGTPVFAQDNGPGNSSIQRKVLPAGIPGGPIVQVQPGVILSQGTTYRLPNCDTTRSDAPCLAVVTATAVSTGGKPLGVLGVGTAGNYAAQAIGTVTLTCGIKYYSLVGFYVGANVQNVNATFSGSAWMPVRFNYGDTGGTWWGFPSWVDNINGPTPSPAWGVTKTSGDAWVTTTFKNHTGAQIINTSIVQWVETVRVVVNSGGWRCEVWGM